MSAGNFIESAEAFVSGLSLTKFDIIIFTIVGLSTLIALYRGFVKSFVSLVGWIISLVIAFSFYDVLSPIFEKHVVSKSMADLLSFGAIFISAAIVIAIINHVIITALRSACGGILDRSFGLFFGLVRGCLLVSAVYYVMILLIPALNVKDRHDVMHNDKLPKWAQKSESLLLLSKGANFIETVLPDHFQENLKRSFSDQEGSDHEKKEASTVDYYSAKKSKASFERSSSIKSMNQLLAMLPREVIDETTQEDLFVLQDSLADPSIKVQILEKIANNYQKYTNDATYGASPDKIKEQNKTYHRVYSAIEQEIARYNEMVNSSS